MCGHKGTLEKLLMALSLKSQFSPSESVLENSFDGWTKDTSNYIRHSLSDWIVTGERIFLASFIQNFDQLSRKPALVAIQLSDLRISKSIQSRLFNSNLQDRRVLNPF